MEKIRVCTCFSGYDSQCLSLDRLTEAYPDLFAYELVAWSEIDKYAIQAHNTLYPQWADRNLGDVTKVDWAKVPDFDLLIFSSPCFVAGTLVRTTQGLKPIEDISAGDMVLTHTNRYKPVVAPMRHRYTGDMVRIDAMCSGTLTCTANHRFYVRKRKIVGHECIRTFLSPEWLEAGELTKDYYLGYAISKDTKLPEWNGTIDKRYTREYRKNNLSQLFQNPDFWYVMGRYLGDGWKKTSHTGNGIMICCSARNRESLVSALNRLQFRFYEAKERTVIKMTICSGELYEFVARYGYYAHGKRIDHETLSLPTDLLQAFLSGYIDSDGSKTGDLYRITTVSRELAYDLVACVSRAYNCPAKIYFTKRPEHTVIEGRTVSQRDSYSVAWKTCVKPQDNAFYEDGYVWFPIRHITKYRDDVDVYNMEVEEDNSYTANGAIVHNCQDFSNAGLQKGGEEGSGTRSSLLWEFRKPVLIKKPKYFLLENVKSLISRKFFPIFRKLTSELESYGYTNYWQVLNAKDYGVPQNRERVFLVSILNDDGFYHFPKAFELDRLLLDVLEPEVDEKYYVSDQAIQGFLAHNENHERKDTGFM